MRRPHFGIRQRIVGRLDERRGRRAFAAAIAQTRPPYRINVGAGPDSLEGWINTDVEGSAMYLDATRPWPVPSASVSHVFADNVIEHFTLDAGRAFLRYAFRAMVPGGRIRLVTPDPEAAARAYVVDREAGDRLLERHRQHGYRLEHRVDLLRVIYHEGGHPEGYLYDEDALSAEMRAAGFVDVERCRLGESEDPALVRIDGRADPDDALFQMAIQGVKPE